MSELFKNIVKLPPPHTARSYSELTPVYTADEVAKTVSSFEVELAKANERVKELEELNLELAVNVEACCELTEIEMGAAIDRLLEIDNTEARELVKKFALEQKIEVFNAWLYEVKFTEGLSARDVIESANLYAEQLRKGGES